MPRPHIEFIQTQSLPWREMKSGAPRPGASAKILSADTDGGAFSAILRYPTGWRAAQQGACFLDEELYVLNGTLKIDGLAYDAGDYAYLPAGHRRGTMECAARADVLTFFDAPAPAPRDPILRLASSAMAWSTPTDPVVAATAKAPGRKLLREDRATGERTWLLKMGADNPAATTHGRIETHPVAEETFLLEGEIAMPCGVLRPGAYFWRPPGIAHGPTGIRRDLTAFFRCRGGPLMTAWSDEKQPIAWDAPYAPMLPETVKASAFAPYDFAQKY